MAGISDVNGEGSVSSNKSLEGMEKEVGKEPLEVFKGSANPDVVTSGQSVSSRLTLEELGSRVSLPSSHDSTKKWVEGVGQALGDKTAIADDENQAALNLRTRAAKEVQSAVVKFDFQKQKEVIEKELQELVQELTSQTPRKSIAKILKHELKREFIKLSEIHKHLISLVKGSEETEIKKRLEAQRDEVEDNYYILYPRPDDVTDTSVTSQSSLSLSQRGDVSIQALLSETVKFTLETTSQQQAKDREQQAALIAKDKEQQAALVAKDKEQQATLHQQELDRQAVQVRREMQLEHEKQQLEVEIKQLKAGQQQQLAQKEQQLAAQAKQLEEEQERLAKQLQNEQTELFEQDKRARVEFQKQAEDLQRQAEMLEARRVHLEEDAETRLADQFQKLNAEQAVKDEELRHHAILLAQREFELAKEAKRVADQEFDRKDKERIREDKATNSLLMKDIDQKGHGDALYVPPVGVKLENKMMTPELVNTGNFTGKPEHVKTRLGAGTTPSYTAVKKIEEPDATTTFGDLRREKPTLSFHLPTHHTHKSSWGATSTPKPNPRVSFIPPSQLLIEREEDEMNLPENEVPYQHLEAPVKSEERGQGEDLEFLENKVADRMGAEISCRLETAVKEQIQRLQGDIIDQAHQLREEFTERLSLVETTVYDGSQNDVSQSGDRVGISERHSNANAGSQREVTEDGQNISHLLIEKMTEAITLNRLPTQEPAVFMGDPLTYPIWRAAFDLLIMNQAIPPAEKLLYLRRYVGGAAFESLKGFFLMKSAESFQRAINQLHERYGSSFVVARAFREKLDAWPIIRSKDSEGLRTLSDFLQQCLIASQVIGQLAILDDSQYQRKIMDKLPEWMAHRWSSVVHNYKETHQDYPHFERLAAFIKEQADISCEPVFGLSNRTSATSTSNPGGSMRKEGKPSMLTQQHEVQEAPNNPRMRNQSQGRQFGRVDTARNNSTQPKTPTPAASNGSSPVQRQCLFCKRTNHYTGTCKDLLNKPRKFRHDFLMNNELCLACGRTTLHWASNCTNRELCKICNRTHLTVLHETNPQQRSINGNSGRGNTTTDRDQTLKKEVDTDPVSDTPRVSGAAFHCRTEKIQGCTSMIVPVFVSSSQHPEREVMTYALLDTMSAVTFVADKVRKELTTTAKATSLNLHTITSSGTTVPCDRIDGLRVRAIDSTEIINLPPAFTTEALGTTTDTVPTRETAARYTHLSKIQEQMHAFQPQCEAGLLIGYNCPKALMPLEVIPGEPYGIRTSLGWSIVGSPATTTTIDSFSLAHEVVEKPVEGNASVKFVYRTQVSEASTDDCLKLLERDFIETGRGKYSQEDQKFLSIVGSGVEVNSEQHYQMPLPFKHEDPVMPNNRNSVWRRTTGLARQFDKRPQYKEDYVKFMAEIISKGHVEKVPIEEMEAPKKWYIPHHGVYSEKKPGKIRVVFDCSARYQDVCINDVLLQGPDLINSLIGVLCRFRKGKIAFSCDIEKMFHQFHVKPEHRDYLRFLWWEDGDTSKPLTDYRMKVHIFGASSSPGCANFGLKQVAKDNTFISGEAATFLQEDFYVDDGLHAADDVTEATTTLQKAREICEKGSLRLHKIVSNSKEFLKNFPESELSISKQQEIGRTEGATVERTLGLHWNLDDDSFTFISTGKKKPETRRGVLSAIASLYDPLGFLAPVILKGRQLLQHLCKEGYGWDDAVPEEITTQWREWLKDLENLGEIRIPRSYLPSTFGKPVVVELHHFSDASEKGYGQCSYLRIKDKENHVHCSLVMAKGRVSPLKTQTIPRLELQAAVLSAKVAQFLEGELGYETLQHYYWTDSQIVLAYLKNEHKKFHVFVANRISQILQFTKVSDWGHVISGNNPADLASRGMGVRELAGSMWYNGPKFLWEEKIERSTKVNEVDENDTEVRSCKATFVGGETLEETSKRFSQKRSFLRGVAFILRFCAERRGEKLSRIESMKLAETRIVKRIQIEHFTKPSSSMKKTLLELDCKTMDDGLMRVGGRLSRMKEEKMSQPVILPRDSHVSLLWVRECHENRTKHGGRTFTIHMLREAGYWIVGVRKIVREVQQQCRVCLKLRGNTEVQKMSDLPEERITESPPFTDCGMDLFGPFLVKERRSLVKRYGLIITCLASRAIHLEVLNDISTDALILGIRRLVALRGDIRRIRCDRGTNFIGAEKEFKKAWEELDREGIVSQLTKLNCDFVFNPPTASHQGGVWERMIRSVRTVLSGMRKRINSTMTAVELQTLFAEVAAVVNSRPLSVESLEDPLGPLPLTPNRILTMKSPGILPPPGVFEETDLYVRKRWRSVQRLADEFWRLWRRDYLMTLQRRRKWQTQHDDVAVDDVVILKEEGAFRNDWTLARVTKVHPSADGLVRSCTIIFPTRQNPGDQGKGVAAKMTELQRPITKLVVLVRAIDHQ